MCACLCVHTTRIRWNKTKTLGTKKWTQQCSFEWEKMMPWTQPLTRFAHFPIQSQYNQRSIFFFPLVPFSFSIYIFFSVCACVCVHALACIRYFFQDYFPIVPLYHECERERERGYLENETNWRLTGCTAATTIYCVYICIYAYHILPVHMYIFLIIC